MPKMKTKKCLKGRFKVTANGKLLRRKQGKSHLLAKKASKRKQRLTAPTLVSTAHLKLYKKLLGAA